MDLHDLIRQVVEAKLKADRTQEAVDRILQHIRQFRQQLEEHFRQISPENPSVDAALTQARHRMN
jgi:hypothetical protein